MNTRLLRTLLAIHQYGSMAEAARRLNVTNGAIAQQIRSLESILNVVLVHRAGRVVHLTEAAHRILNHAQKILDDVAELDALAKIDQLQGRLRLGAGNTVIAGRLPEILVKLGKTYPEIQVSVTTGLSVVFYEMIQSQALDIAIAVEPKYAPTKETGWELLSEEQFFLIAPPKFEGADPHVLLQREPFIRYDRQSWAGVQIDAYLRDHQIIPKERFELASTEIITRLVHEGLGVAIVPSAWQLWGQGLHVISLGLNQSIEPRRFGLIWARSSRRLQLIEAFRHVAMRVYGESPTILKRQGEDK